VPVEQRRSMTSKRLLATSALFAFLYIAAPAAGQDSGGGAAVPGTTVPAEPAAVAPAEPPPAEATQDDQPTTPEGEEQPPEEQPDGEQPPTEENGGTENAPSGEAGGGLGGETGGGGLPQTGFEVAALTSIGLGLLLAGAALRPTSSWPPPRDRPSRSTPRR
jgi:hypothetical protein